ncbi:hypothetical protein AVEN_142656-1 [Araneus ventricosus]|uniref:Uncharacterized protein n=1 Tax=Araneus ventricosus TaxID=182803 RepID=A0A4Y2V863_ARAVE|nr:hypothetical protein AVEN_142656-1 [Araneus ventricosus]
MEYVMNLFFATSLFQHCKSADVWIASTYGRSRTFTTPIKQLLNLHLEMTELSVPFPSLALCHFWMWDYPKDVVGSIFCSTFHNITTETTPICYRKYCFAFSSWEKTVESILGIS